MRRALFLLMLAGCGGTEPVAPETLEAPGPHAVGVRSYTVTYTPPLATEPRSLTTLVWYPAEAVTDGERPFYVLRSSDSATTDAPPLDLGPRPVVVFSHGHQAYAAAMSHWMEHLASHGFVAIAPTHAGNTFLDGDDRKTEIYYQRPHDVRAALDHLEGLGDDPLAGILGDTRVVSGHSFGAYTAFALAGAEYAVADMDAACTAGTGSTGYCSTLDDDKRALFTAGFEDDRFDAVISFDPGDFPLFGAGVKAVDVPVLHVVAEASGNPPNDPGADDYWSALDGEDDVRWLLLGGDHNDFTDACDAGLDVRCSALAGRRVFPPVHVYALAFLRGVVLGEEGYEAILNGEAEVSSLAEVRAR